MVIERTRNRSAHARSRSRSLPALVASLLLAGPGGASAAPSALVGKLTKQYLRQCDKDGKTRWVKPHYQIGFISVVPARGLRLDAHLGKTVVAHGAVSFQATPSLPSSALENCPGQQMRNDWVQDRGGMRVRGPRPGLLGRVRTLHVTRVTTAKLLWLDRRGDRMRVRIRNSLSSPLRGLVLHARYERCFGGKRKLPGKPMPASETRKLGDLAPARRRALSLPLVKSVLPGKFKKTHTLREVYLISAARGTLVDLSQEVQSGLDRTCR